VLGTIRDPTVALRRLGESSSRGIAESAEPLRVEKGWDEGVPRSSPRADSRYQAPEGSWEPRQMICIFLGASVLLYESVLNGPTTPRRPPSPPMAASRPALSLRSPRASANGSAAHADLTRVLDSIRAIVRTLRLSGRAAEQSLGVNAAQHFVLQKLGEEPANSLAELASRTRTDPSSVSVVVSRLVARGLVSRESSAEDARRVTIALTPAGRALLRRTPRNAQSQLLEAAASLPPRQLRGLADCLADLVEHMDADTESDGQRAPAPRRTRAARR